MKYNAHRSFYIKKFYIKNLATMMTRLVIEAPRRKRNTITFEEYKILLRKL